jgi:hypothetical protein
LDGVRQGRAYVRDGQTAGAQTYRVTISGGVIIDRLRVEPEDVCASETYEPV